MNQLAEQVEQMTQPFADLSVIALQADDAACGHYRVRYPVEMLARGGARAEVVQGLSIQALMPYDVVIAQRQYHPQIFAMLMEVRRLGKTVIFEIDDNVHAVHPTSVAYRVYKPGSETCQGIQKFIQHSDALFTSSPELASQYGAWNRRTWVLPNQIDFGIRDWETPVTRDPRLFGKVVVGWAGSITHQDDWRPIAGVMGPILAKYRQAIFAVVSAHQTMDAFTDGLGLDPERVVRLDPTNFERYPALPAQFDIGLAPVVNTTFNRAKCLSASTRVSTPQGLQQVGELRAGSQVWSGTAWVPVLATEQQIASEGLIVRTRRGYELRMTPNHRVMTAAGWRRADTLAVGERLSLSAWEFGSAPVTVPFPLWTTRHSHKEAAFDATAGTSLPTVAIDERWGEILGLYAGDGSIGYGTIHIHVDFQDVDLIDHLADLWSALGLRPTVRRGRLKTGFPLRVRSVCTSSTKLTEFLEYLGVARAQKRIVTVPEAIWRSPRPVVAAYLRGYFEADGTCGETRVVACCKDLPFLGDIQQLLLGFGITSSLQLTRGSGRYADRTYGKLALGRAEVDRFAESIGFLSDRKREKLKAVVARPHSNAYRPIRWEDEIISIEGDLLVPVDIQVPGETFIAGGFVSHNSDLKPLEYGARRVPYVASAIAPYARLHAETGGQGGFLADRASDWIAAISHLIEDETDRRRRGEFMFQHARNERSIDRNAWRWAEAIREARAARHHHPEGERRYVVREKPGRNDPCPCGKGKKYKVCCSPAWG